MWLRLSLVLLVLGFQDASPAKTSGALRQRYGNPISETYLVRPGIVVSATYGPSGSACELVIAPKEPDVVLRKWPGIGEIDYPLLEQIEDETVARTERGRYIMGTFLNIICLPENDCAGSHEDWENVIIYRNSGRSGAHYDLIQWKRNECGEPKLPVLSLAR